MKKFITKYGIITDVALIIATAIFLIIFFNRSVIVPEVTGKSISEATKILNDAGFKIKTSLEYSDTVLKDNIISQEQGGGIKVKIGTEIALVVSKGKEQITLPKLIDCSAAQAENTLKELGFSVITREGFSDTIDKGNVMAQSVAAGKEADKGSKIILTISKGPNLVTVPNLKGMTLEQAEQTLKDLGLYLKTELQFTGSVKEGYIISQDATANEPIRRYSVICAKISGGVCNTKGTTPSNANNFGYVTTQGDWTYFSGSDDSIYRMREDKSEIQLICKVPAVCINVIGEWIYFVNGAKGGIYKIKIDGTEKTKISNITSYKVYVEDEWIYYTSEYSGGVIYKMKTDGTSVTQITSERCNEFVVSNGFVYYINSSDYLVYRCTTNGKANTVLCAGFGGTDLALVGDRLAIADGYNVKSVNLDGSDYTSFGVSNVQYTLLNGYDGWLYYLEHDFRSVSATTSSFGKMKPDGSQKSTIFEYEHLNHANSYLNVTDNWIYFQNEHDGDTMYRVRIDGTKFERVG